MNIYLRCMRSSCYARAGFFRSANGGTLFLDELGKASLDVQRRLLRVVESGRFYPVGSDLEMRIDVRLIFATSIPMKKLIEDDLLLRDLYARLRVFTVRLPPLRDRPEDIPDLVGSFLKKHSVTHGYQQPPKLARETMRVLCRAEWLHNVRELESAIIALIVEAHPAPVVDLEHFRSDVLKDVLASANRRRKRRDTEHVVRVFKLTDRNIAQTSDVLGIGRDAVRSHLSRYGISDAERAKLVRPGRRPKRTQAAAPDPGHEGT